MPETGKSLCHDRADQGKRMTRERYGPTAKTSSRAGIPTQDAALTPGAVDAIKYISKRRSEAHRMLLGWSKARLPTQLPRADPGQRRRKFRRNNLINAFHRSPTWRTVPWGCAHSPDYPHFLLHLTDAFLPAAAQSDGRARRAHGWRAKGR